MMQHLVVIGGASLDTLHFRGRTVRSAGGAGLYTSLAARRAGATVTMVGPRPDPVPEELAAAVDHLDWRGPTVLPERLPSFEIAHLGGGRTELRGAWSRAEEELSPEQVPRDLPAGMVYCIPLTDPVRQLELVRHFKQLGRICACGTYIGAVQEAPEIVLQALATADIFFCNETEASVLFGGLAAARTEPGKLLFITRSARGVRVVQGEHVTDVSATKVEELDPTGAGDTFCGTTLAFLAQGTHPIQAARHGAFAAAEMVTEVGPTALWRPPTDPVDGTVRIDSRRVGEIARVLASATEVAPFSFTGADFPPAGDPGALDYFFAATLQQFGFWSTADGRYLKPTIATFRGRKLKGSDYLWAAYRAWLDEDSAGLTPEGQDRLTASELDARCRSDSGQTLPASRLRWEQARSYGHDLLTLGLRPAEIVSRANADPQPLRRLLAQLDLVGGYKEDPLRKKSVLLALILRQRPEGFLRVEAAEAVPPVVDYHIQRSCLRTGLVAVDDPQLRRLLSAREVLGSEQERQIRQACYDAVVAVQRASGCSMGAVDWFFFQARRRCPEMSDPECAACALDPACAHEKALFQPVLRTTFY